MTIEEQYKYLMNAINSEIDNNMKINYLKQFKDNVLNSKNTGKKVIKTIYGSKVKIPKKYLGKYVKACQLLDRQKNIVLVHDNKVYSKLYNQVLMLKPIIFRSPFLREEFDILECKIKSMNYTDLEKYDLIRQFISKNTATINFLKGTKLNQPVIDNEKDLQPKDLVGLNNSTVEVKKDKKPKKKNFKTILKVVAAVLSVVVVMVAGKEGVKQVIKKQSLPTKKFVTTDNSKEKKNTTKKVVKKLTVNKRIKSSKAIKTKMKVNSMNLDTSFIIKKNRYIYNNLDNSVNKKDGYNMYYDASLVRGCMGYGVKYKNNYITIIKISDNNYEVNHNGIVYLTKKEANNYLNNILNKGGKIESVLSGSKNDIEGFYNIEDIKVKKYA